jgi:hypothetical protein
LYQVFLKTKVNPDHMQQIISYSKENMLCHRYKELILYSKLNNWPYYNYRLKSSRLRHVVVTLQQV